MLAARFARIDGRSWPRPRGLRSRFLLRGPPRRAASPAPSFSTAAPLRPVSGLPRRGATLRSEPLVGPCGTAPGRPPALAAELLPGLHLRPRHRRVLGEVVGVVRDGLDLADQLRRSARRRFDFRPAVVPASSSPRRRRSPAESCARAWRTALFFRLLRDVSRARSPSSTLLTAASPTLLGAVVSIARARARPPSSDPPEPARAAVLGRPLPWRGRRRAGSRELTERALSFAQSWPPRLTATFRRARAWSPSL